MSSKRCKIHYRRLNRDNDRFPKVSLARAVIQALEYRLQNGESMRANPVNRMNSPKANSDLRRFLNHCQIDSQSDMIFGTVCLFCPGDMQALLKVDSEDSAHQSLADALRALDIAEQTAPIGMEYLQGITYWLIIGDHFYQIQHTSLSSQAMEEYFTWMLRDKCAIISMEQFVELQAEFDIQQLGEDLGEIRNIEVGGLVPETMVAEAEITENKNKIKEFEHRESLGDKLATTFQAAKKILIDLLGAKEAEKLIDSMPTEAALEVKVSIGYRATRRKIQKEFMQNLASGLRHLPVGQLKIRGKDGVIKGSDARLSAEMNIKRLGENSSLLDLQDALRQMIETHRRFLHDGRIAN